MVDPDYQDRIRGLNRRIDELQMMIAQEEQKVRYLQARQKRLQEEQAVLAAQRSLSSAQPGDGTERSVPLPLVRRIEGFAGQRRATLVSGGASYVVSQGDMIPGGYNVEHIELDGVTLKGPDGTHRLRFGTTPPPRQAPSQPMASPQAAPPMGQPAPLPRTVPVSPNAPTFQQGGPPGSAPLPQGMAPAIQPPVGMR